jgi:uncharacterized protein YbbC (DUF1343 family)
LKKLFISFLLVFNVLIGFSQIKTGAECIDKYIPLLLNKQVAVCCNQTSVIGNIPTIDTLLSLGVNICAIFSPEHGFRGEAEAGAIIHSDKDPKTGISIYSLYGKTKKPTPEQLKNVDIIIFDMQDVGCRFYTYISTLHYVMEATAEANIELIILDRPNPNGYFVDGPVLDTAFRSFVGMHPIPIVHGMTIGEYGLMINGEGWLKNGIQCHLTVIRMDNWEHRMRYNLPIKPSPNLPSTESIYLYPSLCLFEGTPVSIGRGTEKPFQIFGHPLLEGTFRFTPKVIHGVSENPPQVGKLCYGMDLTAYARQHLESDNHVDVSYLIETYRKLSPQLEFFQKSQFDRLAGSSQLRGQITAGMTAQQIYASWQEPLNLFKKIRSKYLLYPDFE